MNLAIVGVAALIIWLQSEPPEQDRVVLLPDADGGTGAVVVRSATGEQLINQAWQSAHVGRDGVISLQQEDAATQQTRYQEVLKALPLPPVSFTVYFHLDTADLTPESQAVVNSMKAELGRRPAPEIQVVGHTDRLGSDEDNDVLSGRRAQFVKELLVKTGISADQIETSARGEREPVIPTADEVAEPRNRRVVISIQ